MNTLFTFRILLLSCIFIFFTSCIPVFSDMQTARTLGKGGVELMPTYSQIRNKEQSLDQHLQRHMGFQAAIGLSDKIDLGVRYEKITLSYDLPYLNEQFHVLALCPKFSLIKDRLAFYIPIGGEVTERYISQIQPTLLFTQPLIKDVLDITFAPKYLITACKSCTDFTAINVNLSVGKLSRWGLRPEYGVLISMDGNSYYHHLSLGLAIKILSPKG